MFGIHFLKAYNFFCLSYTRKLSLTLSLFAALILARRWLSRGIPRVVKESSAPPINSKFIKQLLTLIPITIPSFSSQEALLTYTLFILVLIRSIMSIFVSTLNGKLLKSLITINSKQFFQRIAQLAIIAVPSSLVNSLLDLITHKLSIKFRVSLTRYFTQKYLNSLKNCKMIYVDRQVVHDVLTEEIDMFSTCLSNLFTNVTKPVVDIVLFCLQLKNILGIKGPLMVLAWYSLSGIALSFLSQPVNRMNKVVHQAYDKYKVFHSQIVEYSEEIAFFSGICTEKRRNDEYLRDVIRDTDLLIYKKLCIKTINSIVSKYGALIIAQLVMALPAFSANSWSISGLSKDYIRTSSYFVNISKASARLRLAQKNILSLAAYTEVLHHGLKNLKSIKTVDMSEIAGKYLKSDSIIFENVSVISPEGSMLFESLSFRIDPGMHTLILGPYGSGKSAIFRVLGALWPLYFGTISSPDYQDIMYLSSIPYIPNGPLTSIFSYPNNSTASLQLIKFALDTVKLSSLYEKINSDANEDWQMLPIKQQQLLNLARVIYHKPKFVILDECTLTLSNDLESEIYSYLQSAKITTITLSQRESMLKYHNYALKLQTEGSWSFYKISQDNEYIFS